MKEEEEVSKDMDAGWDSQADRVMAVPARVTSSKAASTGAASSKHIKNAFQSVRKKLAGVAMSAGSSMIARMPPIRPSKNEAGSHHACMLRDSTSFSSPLRMATANVRMFGAWLPHCS